MRNASRAVRRIDAQAPAAVVPAPHGSLGGNVAMQQFLDAKDLAARIGRGRSTAHRQLKKWEQQAGRLREADGGVRHQ
jgi:hypothetical protein